MHGLIMQVPVAGLQELKSKARYGKVRQGEIRYQVLSSCRTVRLDCDSRSKEKKRTNHHQVASGWVVGAVITAQKDLVRSS